MNNVVHKGHTYIRRSVYKETGDGGQVGGMGSVTLVFTFCVVTGLFNVTGSVWSGTKIQAPDPHRVMVCLNMIHP